MAALNASSVGNGTTTMQPLLSTREGKIVDENGTEVILNGLGWYLPALALDVLGQTTQV